MPPPPPLCTCLAWRLACTEPPWSAGSYSSYNAVTNPYAANVDEVRILGTSGQNVDDVHKYSAGTDRYTPTMRMPVHVRACVRVTRCCAAARSVGACLRYDPPRAA